MHNVFVYGTLKRNEWNSDLLAGGKFISEAITNEHYLLKNSGYPYAIPAAFAESEEPLPIIGEVWRVDDLILRSLDNLEGEGRHYHRRCKPVQLLDGDEIFSFIYERDVNNFRLPLCPIVEIKNKRCYKWFAER